MQGSVPHGRLSFCQLSSRETQLCPMGEQGRTSNLQSTLMCLRHEPWR